MQDDDLVTAAEFSNDIAAQDAIDLLKEHGIVAQMNDEGTFDLGIGELPGIEVIVAQSNLEKAKSLLAELDEAQSESCPAWTCKCGEDVDEGFFACWSCGTEYEAG